MRKHFKNGNAEEWRGLPRTAGSAGSHQIFLLATNSHQAKPSCRTEFYSMGRASDLEQPVMHHAVSSMTPVILCGSCSWVFGL